MAALIARNHRVECAMVLPYPLSYRDLEEMMAERGVEADHSTIHRWVLRYVPELDKRLRPHLNLTSDSWRVNETGYQLKPGHFAGSGL